MIKVLYVINSLGKGGAERLLVDIANQLKANCNIEYLICTLENVNEYQNITEGLKIVNCNSFVKLSLFRKNKTEVKHLSEIINTFKPDIIHTHLFTSEIVSRANTFPGIIYITHLHGYENQLKKFNLSFLLSKRKLTNLFEKHWLISRYNNCENYFIAISSYVEEFFLKAMPKKLHNVILLSNAIDTQAFRHDSAHVFHTPVRIVNVGSFTRKKNQQFLLNVVKVLSDLNYPVILELAGNGPDRKELEIKTTRLDISEKVLFSGKVNDIKGLFQNSDIYVHSATYEPFGLALLEAMASGLPVVCLDGKGNRDIIEEGKNGFMIYKQDPKLFAEKIIELIENPQQYRQMSAYCVEFARKYDIKQYVDKLIGIYEEVLKK